jgi:hypothetical protein
LPDLLYGLALLLGIPAFVWQMRRAGIYSG